MASRASTRAVTSEILQVTPKQASEWLENNHVNRKLRPKVVNAYRRDMEQGRWQFTGEPIQISRTGALLNGQHRLHALAGSKVRNIDMLVVSGLPDEAQVLMDQGVSRGIRDALHIEHGHVKNVTIVASLARWLVLAPQVGPQMNPNVMRNKVSAAEAVEVFGKNTESMTEAAYWAQAMRKHIYGSPTAIAYSWFHLHNLDAEANAEFWAGLSDMEWAYPEDPRRAAYRRLKVIHDVEGEGHKTTIETAVISVSVFTRAWNAWRKEEKVESLGIRTKTGIILPVVPV